MHSVFIHCCHRQTCQYALLCEKHWNCLSQIITALLQGAASHSGDVHRSVCLSVCSFVTSTTWHLHSC